MVVCYEGLLEPTSKIFALGDSVELSDVLIRSSSDYVPTAAY